MRPRGILPMRAHCGDKYGIVDRPRITHPAIVADDARMHHFKQRVADLFGRDRSSGLLLLDDGER
jgi:hypothetical protein